MSNLEEEKKISQKGSGVNQSTSKGMTTKVMKGSFWVLLGQMVPMIATFISSPFVIRYLGAEAYGVLLLVAMIPANFAHADIGMNFSSTKFGAEAYGNGDTKKEALVVRTAAWIAFFPTLLVCILLFAFSIYIMTDFFGISSKYGEAASFGLKLTAIAFLINAMSSIFNTPQFSRLKMNLNVLINAGPRALMTLTTPFVLYHGFGIKGATLVACCTALIILMLNVFVSGRLLPELYSFTIDKKLIKPLFSFGKGIVIYGIALVFIGNIEKILLAKIMADSTKNVAYYSVAFTLANMASLFSIAMVQTLTPAFSQLLAPEKKAELQALFSRCVRVGIIILIPCCMSMIVIAKPFFTIWAGEEFGRESVLPFYVLLIGVFLGLIAYIPSAILLVAGKSSVFAKIYYTEIILYGLLAYILILKFGIIGAAFAWSIREVANAILFIFFAKKYTGLILGIKKQQKEMLYGFLVFIPIVLFAILYNNFSYWIFVLLPISLFGYLVLVWKKLAIESEKKWVLEKVKNKPSLHTLLSKYY